MKCCVCGKVINSPEEISWTLASRAGNMYFCKNCHKDTPSIDKRIEKLEERVTELEEENNKMRYLIDDILSIFETASKSLYPTHSTYNTLCSLNEKINKRLLEENKEC